MSDAEFILNSKDHQKAMKLIEDGIIDQLKTIPVDGKRDTELRILELVRQLKSLELHKSAYRTAITTQKVDAHIYETKKRKTFAF